MSKPRVSHEKATIESFRRDPKFAAKYVNSVLENGDRAELLVALRRMAVAYGGVATLARKADLNVKSLYRTLSHKGNPELKSLSALLRAMGMRLAVQTISKKPRSDQPARGA